VPFTTASTFMVLNLEAPSFEVNTFIPFLSFVNSQSDCEKATFSCAKRNIDKKVFKSIVSVQGKLCQLLGKRIGFPAIAPLLKLNAFILKIALKLTNKRWAEEFNT
jgi:hypothetical protein